MKPFAPDRFIGRQPEITEFKRWLANPHASNKILYYYDDDTDKKGGIGKTRLLQECIKISKELFKDIAVVSVDFFRITDRDGERIAVRVYDKLKPIYPGWSANSFNKLRRNDKNKANPREMLSEALTVDLHELDNHIDKHYPNRHCAVLVVIDTFEVIQENPSVAVFSSIQPFPDDYRFRHIRFLIAGRDPINWEQPNWQGRGSDAHSVSLKSFDPDELVDYMQSYGIQVDNPRDVAKLKDLTEGRPILLGLVKDLVNFYHVNLKDLLSVDADKFEEQLVSRIHNIEKPVNWFLLFMAHVYHRFNPSLLKWILETAPTLQKLISPTEEKLLEMLPNLSFVRRATEESDDFTLHDEMRNLVKMYCWEKLDIDPDKDIRQEISRSVISYYENALKDGLDEQMRQFYIVQILYHKAFLDINEGLQYFTLHFHEALALWKNAYARTLLHEIQEFKDQLSADQLADLVMEEARLFLKEENREMALVYYQNLVDEAGEDWIKAHASEISYQLGRASLAMAKFEQASSELGEALKYEQNNQKKHAAILNSLGYILRRQGQFEQAVERYEESINIYRTLGQQPEYERELANTLNNLSYVYCLLGRINEALISAQTGLHLRERLSKNNNVSETAIGFSHSTLGFIYLYDGDHTNAEYHLKKALDAFTHTNFHKGLAICNNRFGLLQMEKGHLEQALKHFQDASKQAEGIDEEAQITSLNGQGSIYCLFKEREVTLGNSENATMRAKEAESYFEQAATLAQDVHDSLQETEARINLARVLAYLGQADQCEQQLTEAMTIAETKHYNKLLGEIGKLRGELSYQQKEFPYAFLQYAKHCHFMALYNPIEYQKALRFLTDKLLALLKLIGAFIITKVLEVLRNYWQKEQLKGEFPEFIRVCDNVDGVSLYWQEESGHS